MESVEMSTEKLNQRVRQLALQLEIADYGMGMPRDYERVLALRVALEQAKKDAAAMEAAARMNAEASDVLRDFLHSDLTFQGAIIRLQRIGFDPRDASRVVNEWADGAELDSRASDGFEDCGDVR
jgi:hypothetical protein